MRPPGTENISKTIKGVAVNQSTFKRAIAEALQTMPEGGGANDVVPFLGPEWDTPEGRKVVSNTMINMFKARILRRAGDKRGVYTVPANFHRRGVSATDQIERSILDSIRKRGGFATFAQIMDDHDCRPHGEEAIEIRRIQTRRRYGTATKEDWNFLAAYDVRDTTVYSQIKTLLRESEVIRQDLLILGLYNLPQDELNTMTLRGYYGGLMARATAAEFGLSTKKASKARDDFFVSVGAAYNHARVSQNISRNDFIQRPKVAKALYALMQYEPVKREINDWYSGETQARVDAMNAAGASHQEIADFREDRRNSREGRQVLFDLLERFEAGEPGFGVNIHCWAPVSFYEVLAAELQIDPVMASRGVVTLDLRGPKLRPDRNTPTAGRLAEVELYRETYLIK